MQHPDEGTIHAWLDGELPKDQSNEIAAHASECPECSAKIAEARGLIAASTRILTALDDVPVGVIPEAAGTLPAAAPARRRRWFDRTDIRAAAVVLVVAGASYLVVKRDSATTTDALMVADRDQSAPMAATDSAGPAASVVAPVVAPVAPPVVAQRMAPPSARKSAPTAVADIESPMAKAAVAGEVSRAPSAVRMDAAAAPAPVSGARAEPSFSVIEGRVVDQRTDKGLGGAQVLLPGTSLRAYTDNDGHFSITNVPPGERTLNVRRIGYAQENLAIAVPVDASVTANVTLKQDAAQLSQVVVTGAAGTTTSATAPAKVAASLSPRVVSVDSATATRRTIYEVSPGVRITLVDSPANTATDEALFGGQLQGRVANVPQRSAKAADPEAASSVVNTISWAQSGHRYELSGPIPVERLQALRRQLVEQKR